MDLLLTLKNKFVTSHPCIQWAYAATTGAFCGEIFVVIQITPGIVNILSIPKNINRSISKDQFNIAIQEKVLDPIEKLPKTVFIILQKQFIYNSKSK